ncbi:amidophosphoribosyltransferase [Beggiatoa leptomitoformis]|uniref:Amidophosphoribosyltransferase n=1 Tax=Beggiatoa leptomitoformis TaxID=288004 RepID=A0A2N9YGA8_9GAMM|nr:amidophosphoribosyltransferase [Beggiatoa leptomitoformis]ALG68167.1 amidophosphoribosyltransferase [Beggiatoa leptomitoformis]AUI69534.1 amidophosphoribosyltransferase [Beggiatoa leptomitoformis]
MCGIIGIVGKSSVNQALYDGLTMLQHRGQDAAGIVTCENNRFFLRKSNGLVQNVFHTRHMLDLRGNVGIGHVRYPTAGCASTAEAQPFYVNTPYGIALAHNGNLTNADVLKKELFHEDLRHINTDSDSEVLLNIFAHELHRSGRFALTDEDIFAAVRGVHRRCRGGYAVVALIMGYGIVAFRDPNGIRPLVYGKAETEKGTEYMVASESAALSVLGFNLIRDVAPGEAVFIDIEGHLSTRQCADNPGYSPCIFELVYMARPDSIMDGISVYKARLRMGKALAKKIERVYPDHDIDVVIPIPDTSRTAALPLSYHLNLKYREGFVKNRYIPRTFIMPGQSQRKKSVKQKLNVIDLEFKDKNVLLVDDSIVRGTTAQQIIEMARQAGARKVYFASAAPPVRYPNVYGIDMPSVQELLAHNRNEEQIARKIGADWVIYQDLEDLIACARKGNKNVPRFDTSCFDGDYVTGDVNQRYLENLERTRNDSAKNQQMNKESAEVIDLHNVA